MWRDVGHLTPVARCRGQWEFERHRSGLVKQFDSLEHMASGYRWAIQRWTATDAWYRQRTIFTADLRELVLQPDRISGCTVLP